MPPKAKKNEDPGPFTFEHDGVTHTIPSMRKVKLGVMRQFKRDNAFVAADEWTWLLIELIAPEAAAALNDMPMEDADDVVGKWTEHSGVGLGES